MTDCPRRQEDHVQAAEKHATTRRRTRCFNYLNEPGPTDGDRIERLDLFSLRVAFSLSAQTQNSDSFDSFSEHKTRKREKRGNVKYVGEAKENPEGLRKTTPEMINNETGRQRRVWI